MAADDLTTWLRATATMWANTLNGELQSYSCAEDYVLDRGRLFRSAPLSTTQLSIVLAAERRATQAGVLFAPRRCFANAAQLVLHDRTGELSYVEGYAVGTVIPIHHAWAVIGGKVVDITWRRRQPTVTLEHELSDHVLGDFSNEHAYYGIPFQREEVLKRFHDDTRDLSFLDDQEWLRARVTLKRRSDAPWRQPARST